MAITSRHRRSTEFSTASMSDLVFLLLIFFMLTSTLIAPNAIKLLLPNSSSRTIARPATVTVYINDAFNYFVEEVPTAESQLQSALAARLAGQKEATIVLRSNYNVPVQFVVNVIDAVNKINEADPTRTTKHKVILATKPAK